MNLHARNSLQFHCFQAAEDDVCQQNGVTYKIGESFEDNMEGRCKKLMV